MMAWLGASSNSPAVSNEDWICEIPCELRNRGQQLRIVLSASFQTTGSGPDPTLIKLLRLAYNASIWAFPPSDPVLRKSAAETFTN